VGAIYADGVINQVLVHRSLTGQHWRSRLTPDDVGGCLAMLFDILFGEKHFSLLILFVTIARSYLLGRGHSMSEYSKDAPSGALQPNDVRAPIDETDRKILGILAVEARIPNNALAERVGIAASTCLGRVRALVASGVIRGFYADIDPAAVGHPLQAIIGVRLQVDARTAIHSFAKRLEAMAEVRNVFFVAGGQDFFVHVVAQDTAGLRQFVVVNLSGSPEVASTETNVILEHFHVQRL
jgi:DNA-binding Lrp family transcriptional regulator